MATDTRPPWVPTREDIERLAHEIAERFHPERIILFGSYAQGQPTDDSDVDLLVVIETNERPARAAARILRGVQYAFPLDLIVRTPGELGRRIGLGDFFLREVVEKGEVLYERAR